MRSSRVLLLTLAMLLLGPPVAARAELQAEIATLGPVTASLSYDRVPSEGTPDLDTFAGLTVAITRDGQEVYRGSANVGACANDTELACHPAERLTRFDERQSISLRDLDGDGEPEVVVELGTGGSPEGCLTLAYRRDGSGYERFYEDFGSACPRVSSADGRARFVVRDTRFPGRWTAPGATRTDPLRVVAFGSRGFVDRTADYRGLLRDDADDLWETYLQKRRGDDRALGVLAAWAADMYRLDRRAEVLRQLRRLQGDDWLKARRGARGEVPQGAAYIRSVDRYGRTLRP